MPEKAKSFFSFDENSDNKELYLFIRTSDKSESIFDDIDLFEIESKADVELPEEGKIDDVFEREFDGFYDDEFTNP